MRWKIMVNSIASIFFVISCGSGQTRYGSDRPINKRFKLEISDTDTIKNNLISCNAVYIKTESIEIKNVNTYKIELWSLN